MESVKVNLLEWHKSYSEILSERICTGSGNPKNLQAHCDFFSCVINRENNAVGGRMWRLLCKTVYKVHIKGNDCNSQSSGGTASSEYPDFQSACPKPD